MGKMLIAGPGIWLLWGDLGVDPFGCTKDIKLEWTMVLPLGGQSRCAGNMLSMGSHDGKSMLGMGGTGEGKCCARVLRVVLWP